MQHQHERSRILSSVHDVAPFVAHCTEESFHVYIDLHGLLDLDPNVRSGYRETRVKFRVKGDADEAPIRELVRKSPVYDTTIREPTR